MAPASAVQGIHPYPDTGCGLSFLLGTDYERKKQKLQEELQLDYKHYVAKKKDLKSNGPRPQPQGLSLVIDERISAKEKLREERKKEYNLFLHEKAQIIGLKRRTPFITSKPGQVQSSDADHISPPASPLPLNNMPTPPREHPASRRDAATLTDSVDTGKSTGTRRRRRWLLCRPLEPHSSEEELVTDREEELEVRNRRRKNTHTPKPEGKEERRMREHRDRRAPLDSEQVEDDNDRHLKSEPQMPDNMRTARPSPAASKDTAEFATGLLIGAAEGRAASQMRKEQYKQELLKQIAEEKRNKIMEKKLELRVAATGATDPEKKPDRIRQFGAVNRQHDGRRRDVPYMLATDMEASGKEPNPEAKHSKHAQNTEQRVPPGPSQFDLSTALRQLAPSAPSLDYFNEDYHRDFSNMLGEAAIPRVAGVPPPIPPSVPNNYTTPYDAAYYYYGTRNPLDPNLSHYQNTWPGWVQQAENLQSPLPKPPPLRPGRRTEPTDQHGASPLCDGELPVDESKQRTESAPSYRDALRQQIKEREARKRGEREDKERYDAKIEAEMVAYNPWGRSGGGAPIKDQKGNLFSDLNQMHRINEETYKNPAFKSSVQTQKVVTGKAAEARAPPSHRISALNDQPSPQQLHMQGRYREALRQQMEDNKRKQAEQREQTRMEEEKEERRVAEQRTNMQREYQEEQRKQRKIKHKPENQSWISHPKTRRQLDDKTARREQGAEKKALGGPRESEEKKAPLSYERAPSPPVPALQKKKTQLVESRASSVMSQLSSRTVDRSERSVSAPHYRRGPVKLQDVHHEVIRELSALRGYLRKEQKELEVQMGRMDPQETRYTPPDRTRRRPRVDVSESARGAADQPSSATTYSVAAGVSTQNIREFNQLKYRDTASREEVLHVYPDPPADAQTLDIQQQALLREQRRKIRLMMREEDPDYLDLSHYYPRNRPGRFIHADSILPSETVFMDVYSGDAHEKRGHQRTSPPPSAKQDRASPQRRPDDEKGRDVRPDESLRLPASLSGEPENVGVHGRRCIRRRDSHTCNPYNQSGSVNGDEGDVSSLRSGLESRVSVESVATEPWLRPGTSACRETPRSRMDTPPWRTHRAS